MTTRLINPATGEVVDRVPRAGVADVDRAVTDAYERFQRGVWRKAPVRERRDVLRRIADLVRRDHESLARLESLNTGKPMAAAR
ncbi:MAG: aldehyde dehydrogenase family protein, partial [Acidimicrobiia bacterium]|nr:aldehyde dehydrogenase family protein [Acidimicrobiia bacterium]